MTINKSITKSQFEEMELALLLQAYSDITVLCLRYTSNSIEDVREIIKNHHKAKAALKKSVGRYRFDRWFK